MYYLCNYSFLVSNGTAQWSQNLDYDALGNIDMKLDYPQGVILDDAVYGEDNNNPYAITSANVNSSLWPVASQSITYNSFNKLTTITEAPYHLAISYGYDHQRTYQELTQSDVVITKKTFVGDGLEIIEKPGTGTIQKIHYLTGGDGSLFAMYMIDQNNQGKMYYIYTDHLGSPNLITDAECNVVQELSYDAWGNRRAPDTWQPYTAPASIPSPLIDRGFTFHEHLYPFTLINMNGRAYDPLVGRFLSADPYIQAPDNPQTFNRYSYCLNNPLRYTDPDGEIIWFYVAVAVIEAGINVYQNWDAIQSSSGWEFAGKFVGYAIVGAGQGVVECLAPGAGSVLAATVASGLNSAIGGNSIDKIAKDVFSGAASSLVGHGVGKFMKGHAITGLDFYNVPDGYLRNISKNMVEGVTKTVASTFVSKYFSTGDFEMALSASFDLNLIALAAASSSIQGVIETKKAIRANNNSDDISAESASNPDNKGADVHQIESKSGLIIPKVEIIQPKPLIIEPPQLIIPRPEIILPPPIFLPKVQLQLINDRWLFN